MTQTGGVREATRLAHPSTALVAVAATVVAVVFILALTAAAAAWLHAKEVGRQRSLESLLGLAGAVLAIPALAVAAVVLVSSARQGPQWMTELAHQRLAAGTALLFAASGVLTSLSLVLWVVGRCGRAGHRGQEVRGG